MNDAEGPRTPPELDRSGPVLMADLFAQIDAEDAAAAADAARADEEAQEEREQEDSPMRRRVQDLLYDEEPAAPNDPDHSYTEEELDRLWDYAFRKFTKKPAVPDTDSDD